MRDDIKLEVLTEQVVLMMQQIQRISETIIEMRAQPRQALKSKDLGDVRVTANVHLLQDKRRLLN
jgi:hypothetical protein